jgi:hypothetical protein
MMLPAPLHSLDATTPIEKCSELLVICLVLPLRTGCAALRLPCLPADTVAAATSCSAQLNTLPTTTAAATAAAAAHTHAKLSHHTAPPASAAAASAEQLVAACGCGECVSNSVAVAAAVTVQRAQWPLLTLLLL